MNAIHIKGVCLGEGRPKTIVSLMDAEVGGLVQSARRAVDAGADCLEWRADFAHDCHDAAAMTQTGEELVRSLPHTPLVFTFRSTGQGGRQELCIDEYLALNQAIAAAHAADVVDIEVGIGDDNVRALVRAAHAQGLAAIVSHHDFAETPSVEWMTDQLARMAELGADIPKLAVAAQSAVDCLHLMEATAAAHRQLDRPLITMAMGACGTISRLAGEAVGSAATFCALGTASAPGQVELVTATKALDALHDAHRL